MNRFLSSINPKYMYASRSHFRSNLVTNLIACLCIILLSSCNKDPYQDSTPELPHITVEGKNTLGFLLDGKVWVPYQDNPGIFTPKLEAHLDNMHLRITARLKKSKDQPFQTFGITIYPIALGIHQILPPPAPGSVFSDQNKEGWGCNEFICKPEDTEINIINFDENNRIVSGTFFFKNAVNICGDTVQITDGRFDVKF